MGSTMATATACLLQGAVRALRRHLRGSVVHHVYDDRLEPLAGEFAQGAVGVGAQLDCDIQIAQYTAQYPHDLFVRTQAPTISDS